ncbi:MAG TPA: GTPase HflX, partial [Nocardioides sp.]|nr:GTPase HflX [Nocardioides sp.]
MTNAPDFNLDHELEETGDWDDEAQEHDDDFESGYAEEWADQPDPEELTTGELDLAERHALRRVAGLSTELEDVTEVEYRQL